MVQLVAGIRRRGREEKRRCQTTVKQPHRNPWRHPLAYLGTPPRCAHSPVLIQVYSKQYSDDSQQEYTKPRGRPTLGTTEMIPICGTPVACVCVCWGGAGGLRKKQEATAGPRFAFMQSAQARSLLPQQSNRFRSLSLSQIATQPNMTSSSTATQSAQMLLPDPKPGRLCCPPHAQEPTWMTSRVCRTKLKMISAIFILRCERTLRLALGEFARLTSTLSSSGARIPSPRFIVYPCPLNAGRQVYRATRVRAWVIARQAGVERRQAPTEVHTHSPCCFWAAALEGSPRR